MSGMILCRTRQAENPFEVKSMGILLHNLEELCFYIYHNIYLVGTDLINSELVDFIRQETKEDKLADRLEYLIEQNAGLAEMVVTILKYVDYYDDGEIEQIREILETLNTQNVMERLKARADSFLANKSYYHAITGYERIIEADRDPSLSGLFYASVYQNIGVAFTRMFLYNKAAVYFEQAYRIGQHEESKKCYLVAKYLAKGNNMIENDDTTEEEYVLKREIETIMDNTRYDDGYRKLQSIEQLKEQNQVSDYYHAIDDMIHTWEKKYLKYTS